MDVEQNTENHEEVIATVDIDDSEGESSDGDEDLKKRLWIRNLTETEGCFESPIDINITHTKALELPPMEWFHFEVPPKKIKVTNTGKTIICSAKWKQERPYITGGPFLGNYVFSNFHLHWGANPMEGSEHTADGVRYPGEIHVVTFKSSYLTQESALKEQDGCATLVYFLKLQDAPNEAFQLIIDTLLDIAEPGTSKKIQPVMLTSLIHSFTVDYFMYWGAVSTEKCQHYVMWLITRSPIAVSAEQVDALRYIFDDDGTSIKRNFREVQDLQNRSVFHISPSSAKYSTLLPPQDKYITQVYRCEVFLSKSALLNAEENGEDAQHTLKYAIEVKQSNDDGP